MITAELEQKLQAVLKEFCRRIQKTRQSLMAGNLIYLRRRIKSVKNTQKLTRAMKTVAAAKLRRATSELKKSRPYRDKIAFLLQQSGRRGRRSRGSRCSTRREKGTMLLVVVASDKGLCGAFNSHVLKQSEAYYRELIDRGRGGIPGHHRHQGQPLFQQKATAKS